MTATARGDAARRRVRVEDIMGTTVSVHVVTSRDDTDDSDEAVAGCFAELRELDRVFSTYRDDSDISRLRRGDCHTAVLDRRVGEVAAACARWEQATAGRFDAHWRGWFDPTGYVKGWAVETAARRHLGPLVYRDGITAVGINAGGDMQLFTAPDADWCWRVGIADPARPGALIATLDVVNGAVATSGSAERGDHIIDPRTGTPCTSVRSATVVADGLAAADVWATAAVVSGIRDLSWIGGAASRSGVVVGSDGTVRRWLGATEISVETAPADLALSRD